MPSWRGEVFHFTFHFHYLSAESINARRIREMRNYMGSRLPWPGAYPPLCSSLSPSLFSSLAPSPSPPRLHCLPTVFPVLFFSLLNLLIVMAALLPSDIQPISSSPTLYCCFLGMLLFFFWGGSVSFSVLLASPMRPR